MIELTHEDAYAELAAVALDVVPGDAGAAIRDHAGACPECGPELAAMEETVAALGRLVSPATINRGRSAGIRSRLVMRARAERESRSAPVPGRPDLARGVASLTGLGHRATPGAQRPVTGETRRVTPAHQSVVPPVVLRAPGQPVMWYAVAATAALIATGAQLMRVSADRAEMRGRLMAVDTLAPVADSLESTLNQRNAMIAAMTGADVKIVPLMNDTSSEPLGRVMWNRASNDWVMIAHGLRQPREGMIYQVWLVTDDAKISAGTFRPDGKGNSMMQAKHALDRNALRSIAVTEEPEGGMPAPTGPTVVAGSA